MNTTPRIGIIGLGMVGEPLRRWFQEHRGHCRGVDLFCYDTDPKKGYADDVNKADIIFVSVPTPSNPDGSCNVSIVESVVASIADGKIIVVKSTIPPGTVQMLQDRHPQKRILHNPEYLTESQAWEDFINPDRQIIAPTQQSMQDAIEVLNLLPQKHFIRPWSADYAKKSVTSTESELGKYASNVFGYMKVVYGNVLSDICYALNEISIQEGGEPLAHYDNLRDMLSADLRIGRSWLDVEHGDYCGAGGYCFPKDMSAFIAFVESLIEKLEKKSSNREFLKVLRSGVAMLKAVREYNTMLLEWQGLSVEDVAQHDKEVIIEKRKEIRKKKA